MDKLNEWVVLVVDDSQVFRSILDVYLRDMVGTLLGAEDGIDALEVLNTRHVNLVITDLSMPRMDGALLVREIRMHPQRHIRTLPVILMTAEKDARILDGAAAAGANELVTKPIKPATLRQAVSRLLMPPFDVAERSLAISPT